MIRSLFLEVARVWEVLLERQPEDRDCVWERHLVSAPGSPRYALVEAVQGLVGRQALVAPLLA